MLSKNRIKEVTALHHKKFRNLENVFIVEGEKIVADLLLSGWKVLTIFATPEYINRNRLSGEINCEVCTEDEMSKITALTTASPVLAVVEMPPTDVEVNMSSGLKLVLDGIKDPGNFGALCRIADWFGIDEIICSNDSVDCFNPKVVQSSMGSLFHLKVVYTELTELFRDNLAQNKLPVYGTLMEGENIFRAELSSSGFIVLGNESNGISLEVEKYITKALTIPIFSNAKNGLPDSLNVAVAAGIVAAQFRKG
ncbi:MAG: RNA methyltransferase [Bacteroidetes bacterium]|nr:RNA methyltransferase [Bacteroidota bacterium]